MSDFAEYPHGGTAADTGSAASSIALAVSVLTQLMALDRPKFALQWLRILGREYDSSFEMNAHLCFASIHLGRRKLAERYFYRAEALAPSENHSRFLEANLELHFGDAQRAIELLAVEEQRTSDPKIRFTKALAHFRNDEFFEGLVQYESRFAVQPSWYLPKSDLLKKRWIFGRTPGKRITIWREQGIGDELVFLKHISAILMQDYEISIVTSPCLRMLVARKFPNAEVLSSEQTGIAEIDGRTDTLIFAGSVPLLAKSISEHSDADDTRRPILPARTAQDRPMRVGIAWRTSSSTGDARRSVSLRKILKALEPYSDEVLVIQPHLTVREEAILKGLLGSRYVGKARCSGIGEPKHTLLKELKTCDYILSVSTTVSHVSYFADIPTILLLPTGSDPRWSHVSSEGFFGAAVRVIAHPEDKRSRVWSSLDSVLAGFH